MDYKFILTLVVNVLGLGIMGYQVRIMKQQLVNSPSPRSTRRIEFEKKLSRRLYTPVFIMGGLVLLSWLPFVVNAGKSSVIPHFMVGWSGFDKGCNAAIDTSGFIKLKDKYRLFLICRIADPRVDEMEDTHIAVSTPRRITGGILQILIEYKPSDPITVLAQPGSQTLQIVAMLPKERDGSEIKRLSDVANLGGQILLQGGKLQVE